MSDADWTRSRRLRFGAFLLLAVFAGVQLADNAAAVWPFPPGGAPSVPYRASMTVAGHGYVTSYQIRGAGGYTPQTLAFQGNLACNPCSVKFYLLESSITVAGGGAFGVLPPLKVYEIANYHGDIGYTRLANGKFAMTFGGVAERIREVPPGYPS